MHCAGVLRSPYSWRKRLYLREGIDLHYLQPRQTTTIVRTVPIRLSEMVRESVQQALTFNPKARFCERFPSDSAQVLDDDDSDKTS